jgi:hypothetical protein
MGVFTSVAMSRLHRLYVFAQTHGEGLHGLSLKPEVVMVVSPDHKKSKESVSASLDFAALRADSNLYFALDRDFRCTNLACLPRQALHCVKGQGRQSS